MLSMLTPRNCDEVLTPGCCADHADSQTLRESSEASAA